MLQNRIIKARGCAEKQDVDAILFFNLSNVRYLAGFTGSDGVLVVGRDSCWFLTDSRYTTQAAREVTGCPTVEYRVKLDGIAELCAGQGFRRVGFEAEHTTVALLSALTAKVPGVEFVPLGEELAPLRIVKDADELDLLAETARIASEALLASLDGLKPGVVEREYALDLEFAMRRAGADDKSFDFIVASGERGALPHGRASTKVIGAGELVTIDFGAIYGGYHSDETVTVCVGEPDARQREIYGIVKGAHDRALAAVRPGVSFKELDAIARGFIEERGYGAFFGHGLGHGVGLDVHEKPVVSPRGEGVAEEGMVFTIEPGIYIPQWGGVRIEDTVAVTGNGYRLLTRVPKELIILNP
ncbi:Xaa-Pro peptidase family protein [Geobacter hydrogenophilus]|uniref:M24 family metallopeptidase n=1 Tax=Geobacter hydrogenophilus TaxID=40983 RepID=UPI001BD92E7F|nr:Xaa-Pro peptidase family protein [Geobacter hydrogenophilus]MBT0894980.1 Xaa-Pro peptidase family protein [Geobacter hydrogenophilus]